MHYHILVCMDSITVDYVANVSSACCGKLTITQHDNVIYEKEYRCFSTCDVHLDDDHSIVIPRGELLWRDADKFSDEIQAAVRLKLESIEVCCGGCE